MSDPLCLHGNMVQLYGYGVFIEGESGIGKSLATFELLKRGAQLIADDIVHLHHLEGSIIGSAPSSLYNLLEVRGLGLIRPSEYFGHLRLRRTYPLNLVIKLIKAQNTEDFQQQRISPLLDWCYYFNERKPHMTVLMMESMSPASLIESAVGYWHLLTQREATCTPSSSVADQALEKPSLYIP